MASAPGLVRRRAANNADDNPVNSPIPKDSTTTYDDSNGHKIAFDPRDISESSELARQPKLTLMEEVLLMGLNDEQGYTSFWNDSISYALRGCIVMELAFRGRIRMKKPDLKRGEHRLELEDHCIEVIDDALTGEVLLDEALKMMKSSEKMSVPQWIDLMSGETWNLMKIGYQLKQVRERLAKGLVEKGILRTEKKNFLLFDMATHPVADSAAKDDIRKRVQNVLTSKTIVLNPSQFLPAGMEYRYLRTLAMICAAYAANVLENVLTFLQPEARERSYTQVDHMLKCSSEWPFKASNRTEVGANFWDAIIEEASGADKELHLQVIAVCLSVFGKLDSLL